MIIPPGYYAGALKADNLVAVKKYIVDVSEASPVPLYVPFLGSTRVVRFDQV